MLTSKSTQGCRLSLRQRHEIRAVGRTGLTTGRINPADALGKTAKSPKSAGAKRSRPYKRQRGTMAKVGR